jgi:hypothetical protein
MGVIDTVRKLREAGATVRGKAPRPAGLEGEDWAPEAPAGGWAPIYDDEGQALGEPAPVRPTDVPRREVQRHAANPMAGSWWRLALAGAALALALAAVPAGAMPGNGGGIGRTGITVTAEPAGANCAAGGIRIDVERRRPPKDEAPALVAMGLEPLPVILPPPPPEVDTFYICNGVNGTNGADGGPGPAGPVGPAGAVGPAGPVLPSNPDTKCGPSLRFVAHLYLPARLSPFASLVLRVDSKAPQVVKVKTDVRGRFVNVPMRGRHCGGHLITVGRSGVVPVAQIWVVRGHLSIYRKPA